MSGQAFYVKNTPRIRVNREFPYPGVHEYLFGQFVNNFYGYHPMRAGCIPYTYENGHFYFFLSVDQRNELGDFGGGITKKEDTVSGALRECLEESSGIFGFNVRDVNKRGFIMYSDEIAVIFIPISNTYLKTIKPLFQNNLKYYDQKKREIDAKVEHQKEGINKEGVEQKEGRVEQANKKEEDLSNLVYEQEILKAMTEKLDIEIIPDTELFDTILNQKLYNGRNYYHLISNLLIKSKQLLYRNLQKISIPTINIPYAKIIQSSRQTFSDRKNKQLQAKIGEIAQ